MRLLNSSTFRLREFFDSHIPEYVILSHTWGSDEVTFQDIADISAASRKKGFEKIKRCCDQAALDGFQWAWIDTCCIDKTSSSELSEAINSMYRWYQQSKMCYAYLEDVECKCDQADGEICGEFEQSRWFTRGWTLQELVAPLTVEFYSKDWSDIGTKLSLAKQISDITGINIGILRGKSLSTRNIAERMSWASKRETTRSEDMAYSLIGIFNINMPMLYGEGGKNAFIRLQQEILKISEDWTLLAWQARTEDPRSFRGALAESPKEFQQLEIDSTSSCQYSELDIKPPVGENFSRHTKLYFDNPSTNPPALTSKGLQISLALRGNGDTKFAFLNCQRRSDGYLLCIHLVRPEPDRPYHWARFEPTHLAFFPPTEVQDFKYSPLFIREPSDWFLARIAQGISKSLEQPHKFNMQFESNFISSFKSCSYYPEEDRDGDSDTTKIDHTSSVTRVIEFHQSTGRRFMIIVGTKENMHAEPWCDVRTQEELAESSKVDIYREYQRSDGEDVVDRVKKYLSPGEQIFVSVRKAGTMTESVGALAPTSVRQFTLHVAAVVENGEGGS